MACGEKVAREIEKLRKAGYKIRTVTIKPSFEETVRRFCERVEEIYRRSSETSVRLRNP